MIRQISVTFLFLSLYTGIDQLKRELEKKQRILEKHLKQKVSGENLKMKALEEHLHKIVISLRKFMTQHPQL